MGCCCLKRGGTGIIYQLVFECGYCFPSFFGNSRSSISSASFHVFDVPRSTTLISQHMGEAMTSLRITKDIIISSETSPPP